jgi:transcriptional regulator with XRE-family HTH domain
MSHKLPNYLRTCRKAASLTQAEVAYLLGGRTGAKVSRYERFRQQPQLETVFAYEAIFRIPARELFAGVYQQIERKTRRRVRALSRRVSRVSPDPALRRKTEFLREVSLGLRPDPDTPS